jgi:hypothetical protein
VKPIVLFSLQFSFSLLAYGLAAAWYVVPRLARLPLVVALQPLLWVHVFRIAGGAILAPGSVGPGVPDDFQKMIGYGDMATAALALLAVAALRLRWRASIALVWLAIGVGAVDTVNAVIQSLRYDVFTHTLGLNWVIVTIYVPALLVSSVLIVLQLLRRDAGSAVRTADS